MNIKLKKDLVTGKQGIVELYRPKSLSTKSGFNCVLLLNIKDNALSFSEPNFFFSDTFIPVSDKASDWDTFHPYLRALKPIHNVFDTNSLQFIAQVSAFTTTKGEVTSSISLIRPIKGMSNLESNVIPTVNNPAPQLLQDSWQGIAEDIFSKFSPDVYKGLSRNDYFRYRLGY